MEIKHTIGRVSPIIDDALAVRYAVFIEEQGFEPELEIDEYDNTALHVVGYIDNQPICVARLIFKESDRVKVGRVAVLKAYRSLGLGNDIMNYLIDYAKKNHVKEFALSAQLHAKNFYLKLGFVTQGEIYLEEGVEHIYMVYPNLA
ncbi:GNAT family N-acetyltransferase [Utexia brackfieldae]|uniref:GNAT family N-acetyltransferase n=1 Tax=Utexia brackfieldae TaxID=3074108 RepID=UPI00370D45F6